jgi:Protein of unknown function DUF262
MSEGTVVEATEVEDWFDEESEEEEEEEESLPSPPRDPAAKYAESQLRVVRETKDYQLDYLQHAFQPGRELIDISPAYQRRLRWNNKRKSLLIESFLLNIPVPPIFLFETDYNAYEVIDGRQRLDAITSFLANDYALVGLEYWPELNRKRFNDLPKVLQRGLLRRSLPAVVLLAETGSTGESVDVRRVLFDRLNTGGVRLNPQELRNALYPGKFNALLIALARSGPFTTAWNIPAYTPGEETNPPEELSSNPLFSSLADAELVLRFFALRDAFSAGKGSLRQILDKYMATHTKIDDAALNAMREDFLLLLQRLVELFDGHPFLLPTTGRPSRPLYDALMIALSRAPELDLTANAKAIRSSLASALDGEDTYDVLVGRGNTMAAIRARVELAGAILAAR